MSDVTFKIQQGQKMLTVVPYSSPLTAAEAKQALWKEKASWVGALQEEGSSDQVNDDQQLKPGCAYTLTLQHQVGERHWLLFFKWHVTGRGMLSDLLSHQAMSTLLLVTYQ